MKTLSFFNKKKFYFLFLFIYKLLIEFGPKKIYVSYLILFMRWRQYYFKKFKSLKFLICINLHILLMPHQNFAVNSNNFGRRSITTPFGVVRGETVIPASDKNLPAVTQYLGIPYGVAPSGQYRFNMAISAPKWTHQPKDAFKFSSVCIQSGLPQLSETEALKTMSSQRFDNIHRIFPFLKPQSEDCLYMNLYVPERFEKRNNFGDSNGLSVLVIVHGGEYGWSAGNAYNATILAAHGQVLIVTLNYRLGVYGFLGRCESNSCTGNAGLSDLVVALKMLSNILPSFGADPTSLTLLGWGSGAALISLLMASPITQPKKRLFRRAILLDGTGLSPWATVDNPQQYLYKIALELQCIKQNNKKQNYRNDDTFQKQILHVVRCLQEHGHQNLTAAARKIHAPTFTSAFAPIIDGQIVPNHPKYSFSSKYGALFRDIDLMIGTVAYPAHYLMPSEDLDNGINLTRRDTIFRTLVHNLFNFHRTEIFDAILNEYTDWDNPKNHLKTIRNNVLMALSDALFIAPLIRTARMHSTDELPKTSNTFFFLFAHETRTKTWKNNNGASSTQSHSGIRGSLTDEYLPYIFGYPLLNNQHDLPDYGRFTNDDKGISRVLMQYISNFIKSGDPVKPQQLLTHTPIEERFYGTIWPQYSPTTREAYLEISDRPRIKNYYRNQYVGFWNSFVPQLNRDNRETNVPEEHNFLPNQFNKHSFFGNIRPYFSFHNDPFPPPPLPPTPFPHDGLKRISSTPPNLNVIMDIKSTPSDITDNTTFIMHSSNNYYLPIVVAVGIGFLVINLCIYALMIRKCSDENRKSKKRLKYQSYTIGHPSTSEITYAPISPIGQLSLSPPSLLTSINLKTDGIVSKHNGDIKNFTSTNDSKYSISMPQKKNLILTTSESSDLIENSSLPNKSLRSNSHSYHSTLNNNKQLFHHQKHSLLLNKNNNISNNGLNCTPTSSTNSGTTLVTTTTLRRLSLRNREQEALFTTNSKVTLSPGIPNIGNSNTTFLRPGISPTCPRHGRAAQMMIAAAAAAAVSRANSVGTSNSMSCTNAVDNNSLLNNYNGAPLLVPLMPLSSSPPTRLEEAQV